MTKKHNKPWYKKAWFYVILIILGLFFIIIYLNNQTYYASASEEYNQISSQIEKTANQISDIEVKYSKNELVYYYEFSDSDLESYLTLIVEQEQNYDKLIRWVISNETYLKSRGKSDLAISELIKDMRYTKEKLEEAKLQVASTQNLQNNLNW